MAAGGVGYFAAGYWDSNYWNSNWWAEQGEGVTVSGATFPVSTGTISLSFEFPSRISLMWQLNGQMSIWHIYPMQTIRLDTDA